MSPINPQAIVTINGKVLNYSMAADILSVSFEDHASDVDMATVVINNKDSQWVDSSYFEKGKAMEVYFGYGRSLNKLFSGRIVRPELNFPESGIPTLTVRAYDHSYQMRRSEQKEKSTWENITDSKLAETIAGKYGFKANQLEIDETVDSIPYVAQGNETDWAFLKERANRLGFELYVELGIFHFHKPKDYLHIIPETYTYKQNLISFEPRLSVQAQVSKVVVKGWDSNSKTPIIAFADSSNSEERSLLGDISASDFVKEEFGEGVKILYDKMPRTQKEAEELAKAYFKLKEYDLIEATGTCVGDPVLKAKQLIKIAGIGRKYSGTYYVTKITHSYDSRGYICDFECKRNALSVSGQPEYKNKEALAKAGYNL